MVFLNTSVLAGLTGYPRCHPERSEGSTSQKQVEVPFSPLQGTFTCKLPFQNRCLRNPIAFIGPYRALNPARGL